MRSRATLEQQRRRIAAVADAIANGDASGAATLLEEHEAAERTERALFRLGPLLIALCAAEAKRAAAHRKTEEQARRERAYDHTCARLSECEILTAELEALVDDAVLIMREHRRLASSISTALAPLVGDERHRNDLFIPLVVMTVTSAFHRLVLGRRPYHFVPVAPLFG